MSISILIGLGNPGQEYSNTRHNVGFIVIDAIAEQLGAQWKDDSKLLCSYSKTEWDGSPLYLVKPTQFMNLSGHSIANFCRYFKLSPENMAVIVDDVNLPPTKSKLTIGGSPAGHNGIENIIHHSGNKFTRFRIGIGPKSHPEMDLSDHVLGQLSKDEKSALTSQLPSYINGLKFLIQNGPQKAMNIINKKKTTKKNQPSTTMSDTATLHNYTATFILDTRNYQEPVETLIERITTVIEAVKGSVKKVQNLGQKDFERVVDSKYPNGIYVEIDFEGPISSPASLKEKLHLDRNVNRILVLSK